MKPYGTTSHWSHQTCNLDTLVDADVGNTIFLNNV